MLKSRGSPVRMLCCSLKHCWMPAGKSTLISASSHAWSHSTANTTPSGMGWAMGWRSKPIRWRPKAGRCPTNTRAILTQIRSTAARFISRASIPSKPSFNRIWKTAAVMRISTSERDLRRCSHRLLVCPILA